MSNEIKFDVEFDGNTIETQELQTWDTEKPVELESDKDNSPLTVRLDKWLWATRFFKTRALARTSIEKGKVLYNGYPVKASKEISLGDKVTLTQGKLTKEIVITGLSTRRRNADDAIELYKEVQAAPMVQHNSFCNRHNHLNGRRRAYNKANNAALPFAPARMNKQLVEAKGRKPVRFLRRANKLAEHNININDIINNEK